MRQNTKGGWLVSGCYLHAWVVYNRQKRKQVPFFYSYLYLVLNFFTCTNNIKFCLTKNVQHFFVCTYASEYICVVKNFAICYIDLQSHLTLRPEMLILHVAQNRVTFFSSILNKYILHHNKNHLLNCIIHSAEQNIGICVSQW